LKREGDTAVCMKELNPSFPLMALSTMMIGLVNLVGRIFLLILIVIIALHLTQAMMVALVL
jgi:hypothetical protein